MSIICKTAFYHTTYTIVPCIFQHYIAKITDTKVSWIKCRRDQSRFNPHRIRFEVLVWMALYLSQGILTVGISASHIQSHFDCMELDCSKEVPVVAIFLCFHVDSSVHHEVKQDPILMTMIVCVCLYNL